MVLVVSLAAIDWGMSLDPDWYSTIYGALYVAGGMLTALCLVVAGVSLACWRIHRLDETSQVVLHDLGKLLLAFLMVWAYFAFSQFLIIYSGNLPVEAVWYQRRLAGGWQWLALAIVVLNFVVPFLLLLSRNLKHSPRWLGSIALGLAVAQILQLFWTIMPSFDHARFALHWLDVVVWVGLGGLWMSEFLRQLKHRLLPVLPHWPYAEFGAG